MENHDEINNKDFALIKRFDSINYKSNIDDDS